RMKKLTLDRFINLALLLAGFVVLAYLLSYFSTLVVYAVVAVIISYLLDPLVSRIQAAGIDRTLGIVLTLSAVILIMVWISADTLAVVISEMIEPASECSIQDRKEITQEIEQQLSERFAFLPQHSLSSSITRALQGVVNLGKLQSVLGNI